jgi:hypothetical protein
MLKPVAGSMKCDEFRKFPGWPAKNLLYMTEASLMLVPILLSRIILKE